MDELGAAGLELAAGAQGYLGDEAREYAEYQNDLDRKQSRQAALERVRQVFTVSPRHGDTVPYRIAVTNGIKRHARRQITVSTVRIASRPTSLRMPSRMRTSKKTVPPFSSWIWRGFARQKPPRFPYRVAACRRIGSEDGIVSTVSLIIDVASASEAVPTCLSRALRGSSPAQCRWLPANMCLSVHNRYRERRPG